MTNLANGIEHFYTADLHLGCDHIRTLCKRPFDDVAEMDEAIVERWNALVGPRDVVWVLGDVTTDTGPSPHIARLNGVKYLIAGNHDTCFAGMTPDSRARAASARDYVDAGFKSVVDGAAMQRKDGRPVRVPLVPGGLTVDLSHFPYHRDPWLPADQADPWEPWRPRPPRRGVAPWLVHGHVHNAERHVVGRSFNVAQDMWDFDPVPAELLAELIKAEEARG